MRSVPDRDPKTVGHRSSSRRCRDESTRAVSLIGVETDLVSIPFVAEDRLLAAEKRVIAFGHLISRNPENASRSDR